MKKLVKRPLQLSTHTVRDLRVQDLAPVVGGAQSTTERCTVPTWGCNHNGKRLVVTP